jgi:membrane glycosyltransferase
MSEPSTPLAAIPTAPPIHRGSMTPRPWAGFGRGLAILVLLRLLRRHTWAPAERAGAAPWQAVAKSRRRLLLALVLLSTALALAVQVHDDPHATQDALHLAQTGLFALLFAWVAAGFVTALMGFACLLRGDSQALDAQAVNGQPIDAGARTAILVPICNEDIATVFGGLQATCDSLRATGLGGLFDVFVLSDTRDGALRAAEHQAWARLRAQMDADGEHAGLNIFYRWRRRRSKRKAGNVADFCRRWGRDYRYMVVMDADSVMSGDCIAQLVRLMEAHPRAGILQTAPRGCGHDSLHARAQAFLGRVTGPLFTRGLAYWQLGESHYWGHNAILRVEPFMRHCALAPLPGRGGLAGDILSHDFVEAALMRRAGHEVWLVPGLDGSFEQLPPHLVDELQRDRRWCQGNLQNARLVAEPGFRAVHRAMFVTGALSYLASPLWLAFVAIGAWRAATEPDAALADTLHAGSTLWCAVLAMLFLPRLLGVAHVLMKREQGAYGGTAGLLGGALLEAVLSALQAPVRMAAHTLFVLIALTGWKLEWKSPSRAATALSWRDAAASLRWLTLPLLVACATLLLIGKPGVALGVAPLLLPLLLAVPLAVMSSEPSLGRALRRVGLLSIPEETRPGRTLGDALRRIGEWAQLQGPADGAPQGRGRGSAWSGGSSLRLVSAGIALVACALFTPSPSTVNLEASRAANQMIESWRQAQLERMARLEAESFKPPVKARHVARHRALATAATRRPAAPRVLPAPAVDAPAPVVAPAVTDAPDVPALAPPAATDLPAEAGA